MGITIKNGLVITSSGGFRTDVRIEGEKIKTIGIGVEEEGDEVINAEGMYVMPGGIDVHTHLDMPFMGTTSSDDFETGTRAAVFGGTTSIIDFIVPTRGQSLIDAFREWQAKSEGKAVIDYGFHCCIPELTDKTFEEMEELMNNGVTSFKLFTAYPNVFMLDDGSIYRVLKWSSKTGALIQFHCENGLAIAEIVKEMIEEGKTDPVYHALSRPSCLEGEATNRVLVLAECAGANVYIVHLTCVEALDAVRNARLRGIHAFAETCPQYLYLSVDDLARPGFEGAKFVCSPPLRERFHADKLWGGLESGDLAAVATDHCPFYFKGQKEMGRGDFRKIPNGLPAIETRVMLVFQGVVDGKLSLHRFVDVVSTGPARIFGLYPKKGAIMPGSDADLVVWNPEKEVDLSVANLHMRVDYSLYEGMKVKGGPEKVFIRGKLVVDGRNFLGKAGEGRYLRRDKFIAS